MEIIKGIFTLIFLFGFSAAASQAQSISKENSSSWGIEVDPLSLFQKFRGYKAGVWRSINDQDRINLDLTYGGPELKPRSGIIVGETIFASQYRMMAIDLQYIHDWTFDDGNFDFYSAVGPMFRSIRGHVDRGYFVNPSNNAVVTHNGALYKNSGIGLAADTGIRVFAGRVTFDFRFGVIALNSDSVYDRIEDPFTVLNFSPLANKFYQTIGKKLVVDPRFSLRAGYSW